ncbi:enterochelin esterase-like enzyme [Luteibacter sp. Sphag1AF]|uniref:alpha/beta hydrolase n=1 Tax=Luteibacter sp. Sphag1AF TaxID=2587031 RepID=UPI00160DAFE4|nr:alpha/beta hydrolase-fold protein [Luteibacter sp. Sphag1AF]MBB3227395.1 enterochelin esterase-like enzyme [Luteibacter sp. Sphag1AF]
MKIRHVAPLFALVSTLAFTSAVCADQAAVAHRIVRVSLDGASSSASSGRLLVFATLASTAKASAKDGKVEQVDTNPFKPQAVSIAAREVSRIEPGASIDIDTDTLAYPAGFSTLPEGDYLFQAVLDVDHSYNYTGRHAGDLVSDVVPVHVAPGSAVPTLKLAHALPAKDMWTLPPSVPQVVRDALPEARQHATAETMVSPALSAFWGRPIAVRAWVVTPPGYDAKASTRYPVVYSTHGFGGGFDRFATSMVGVYSAMAKKEMPPMIWVFLDEASATGTHEFADSVNNGPWGKALTEEFIPSLESRYRMDAKSSGRFLNGHSSGGWATLWLQTRYPAVFGGTWSTSPDPSDFHDFTGVDLYAPHANVYRRADGSAIPLVRDKGKVVATFEAFAKIERVIGPYGGQLSSFEWVFSPRDVDGRPVPMFDRDTGDVNPAVVAYWHDHYDIAARVTSQWPTLKPDLDGKIHLIVGTADTFYLDGAARKLQAALDGVGAKSDFRYLDGRTHFDLYVEGDDRSALLKKISWEMYKVARPRG